LGTKISDCGLKKDKRMLKVESSKKGQEAMGDRQRVNEEEGTSYSVLIVRLPQVAVATEGRSE